MQANLICRKRALENAVDKPTLPERRRKIGSMRDKDIMTVSVLTASSETGVRHASRMILDRGIRGLPVVDDAGELNWHDFSIGAERSQDG